MTAAVAYTRLRMSDEALDALAVAVKEVIHGIASPRIRSLNRYVASNSSPSSSVDSQRKGGRVMFETHFRIAPTAAIALMAGTLLSGCETTHKETMNNDAGVAGVATKVEDVPLLVHFEAGCPTAVTKVVESCDPATLPHDVPMGADLVCRGKDKKIVWLAVTDKTGEAPTLSGDQFTIEFTEGSDPTDAHCKSSTDGVLECHVKPNARGKSKYAIKPDAGTCLQLDPRFYVP
jgi:hypothetical protein